MYTNEVVPASAYFLAYFLAGVSGIGVITLSRSWLDAAIAVCLLINGFVIGQLLAEASRNGAINLLLALLPF